MEVVILGDYFSRENRLIFIQCSELKLKIWQIG